MKHFTLLVMAALLGSAAHGQSYKFSTLYNFKNNGTDPQQPQASLIVDSSGNVYGTGSSGGSNHHACSAGCGTVFKVTATGAMLVLHYFVDSPDGTNPQTSLYRDSKGNLYGSTTSGGTVGCGTVFKLTTSNVESVLYSFACGSDGGEPSNVVWDSAGNIYGTSLTGPANLDGVVFKINTSKILDVLHTFCSKSGCTDGSYPQGGVVRDTAGNLYGATFYGGSNGGGIVFKVTSKGVETVLHNFGVKQSDGAHPYYNLIQDAKGNLYGVTPDGGDNGDGTLFKQPEGGGADTVLYTFCRKAKCADGVGPVGPVAIDAAGNIYGNSSAQGLVWEVSASGKETVLYTFPKNTFLLSGLVIDSAGNLYGTTVNGGTNHLGSVFKLSLQ